MTPDPLSAVATALEGRGVAHVRLPDAIETAGCRATLNEGKVARIFGRYRVVREDSPGFFGADDPAVAASLLDPSSPDPLSATR